jgi:rhodanese-related sulfurtransferase
MLSPPPKRLIVVLSILGVTLLASGEYVEWFHEGFLARHPITVNLWSGAIGFAWATLLVADGFRRYVAYEWVESRMREWKRKNPAPSWKNTAEFWTGPAKYFWYYRSDEYAVWQRKALAHVQELKEEYQRIHARP